MKHEILDLINAYWSFDTHQQHTHSWHDKQKCLEEIKKLLIQERHDLASIGVLTGEAAEQFHERMANPKSISQEELADMKKSHEIMESIIFKPIKEKFYKEFNEGQNINKATCDMIFEWCKKNIRGI